MKRSIRAFWLQVTTSGYIKAVVMRDKRTIGEVPVYSYLPTPSSFNRIKKVGKAVARSQFSLYECEPMDEPNLFIGWVLFRKDKAVYPLPMGTKNTGQQTSIVPNKATSP